MTPSLNNLLKLFFDLNIDFVIIGGFAGALHGSSMVTKDLDLCLLLTPKNIDKLRFGLKDLNPKLRITPAKLSFLDFPQGNTGFNNLYLETDLGIVDLLSQVTGVGDYERVASRAEVIELFGFTCKVMSLSDLMLSKQQMGRPKDLAMIAELKEISKKRKS